MFDNVLREFVLQLDPGGCDPHWHPLHVRAGLRCPRHLHRRHGSAQLCAVHHWQCSGWFILSKLNTIYIFYAWTMKTLFRDLVYYTIYYICVSMWHYIYSSWLSPWPVPWTLSPADAQHLPEHCPLHPASPETKHLLTLFYSSVCIKCENQDQWSFN